MGEPFRVGAALRLVNLMARPAPETLAHGLLAGAGRRSCGGESSKHSLRDKFEDDEPGRPSFPNLNPEI